MLILDDRIPITININSLIKESVKKYDIIVNGTSYKRNEKNLYKLKLAKHNNKFIIVTCNENIKFTKAALEELNLKFFVDCVMLTPRKL